MIRHAATILLLLFSGCCVSVAEPITVHDITIVDGDTIDAHGQRYRMIGYDTPEVSTPRRKVGQDEKALATVAKERFAELLQSGPLDLTELPCSCSPEKLANGTCNHGRKCAILSLNGKNIGDTLIDEELAAPFICSKTRCPKMPDWPSIIERQNEAMRTRQ
jgi:endonuclease YncB( thermonuclease family)